MKMARTALYVSCSVALVALGVSWVRAAGVRVGSSTLIKVVDYSDSFTTTDNLGLPDRDGLGGYPLGTIDYPVNGTPGEGLAVENCHGHSQLYWNDERFSIATDATALSSSQMPYYGGSGAGSDTGMSQRGGWHFGDEGIPYGIRDRFVIQCDAVQSLDRMNLIFGGVRDWMWDASNLAVFIRTTGQPTFPEIGVINPTNAAGEINTGCTSGIAYSGEWHNYAALVDMTARTVEVFIDEVSRGVIDLDTVGGGALAGVTLSNAYVNVGWYGGDRFWMDNFQVGSPDAVNPVQIPGDATGDGNVNAADAARVAMYWGAAELAPNMTWWQMGDFNDDHVVNAADASIMAANWTGGGESAAIPEPGVFTLLSVFLIGLGTRRKRG
jgi:hypothetical protein